MSGRYHRYSKEEWKEKLLHNEQRALLYKEQNQAKATPAEKKLLSEFVRKKLRYVFQKSYFTADKLFIVDFYVKCKGGKSLVIEIDGGYHLKQKGYDAWRQNWIERNRHCRFIRFTNEQVLYDTKHVLLEICRFKPLHQGRA